MARSLSAATFLVTAATLFLASCGLFGAGRPTAGQRRYQQRLEEGRTLARAGRMAEAAEAFEDATYADPEGPEAHFLLARALADLGSGYRAVDELRRAEELRPGYGPQRVLMGRVLTQLGRLEQAEPLLESAVEQWPDEARAHLALGLLRLRQERLAAAEVSLTRALRLDDRLREGHKAAGQVLLRLGRAEEAITRFERATKLSECDDLAHGGLGAALVVEGRAASAQAAFQEAARCAGAKRSAPWRAALCLAYAAEGRYRDAQEEMGRSGSFFSAPVARALTARMAAAGQGWREAGCSADETVCRQAHEHLWAGALLLFVMGAADGAEQELGRAINLYDGDPLTRWVLAETFAELGRPEDALLELDRASAWEPSEETAAAMAAFRSGLETEE